MKKKKKPSIYDYTRKKKIVEKLNNIKDADNRYQEIMDTEKICELDPPKRYGERYLIIWRKIV